MDAWMRRNRAHPLPLPSERHYSGHAQQAPSPEEVNDRGNRSREWPHGPRGPWGRNVEEEARLYLTRLRPQRLLARITRRGALRTACVLTGVMGLVTLGAQFGSAPARAANLDYYWKPGYYLDNGWLCYGWANGAYHCTQHWHRDASGTLVSDHPAWVPNLNGVAADTDSPAQAPRVTHPAPIVQHPAAPPPPVPHP